MSGLPAAFLGPPIAHRGLHDRAAGVIENSLSAVRAAAAAGYGVEIDLQPSSDGEAMVFHDRTLDRVTAETGPVRELDAAALGSVALAGGGGDRIPTLAETLAAAGRAPLLVEIKNQPPEVGVGRLEARAAALLRAHPGPVAVMSFDPASVIWFRDNAPDMPRGLVSYAFDDDAAKRRWPAEVRETLAGLALFEATKADFISYDHADLPTPRTSALRAAGVPVLCWTVLSEDEEREARRHADNITFEGYRAALKPAP